MDADQGRLMRVRELSPPGGGNAGVSVASSAFSWSRLCIRVSWPLLLCGLLFVPARLNV